MANPGSERSRQSILDSSSLEGEAGALRIHLTAPTTEESSNRRLLSVLSLLLVCASLAWATPRRIVLLEEATNASCAPCALNNPKLQEFFSTHFGGVVSVRYHAWWPGANDPMYLENTVDSRARIGYYGISGVPNYVMDGTNYGVPGDPDAMVSQMWERLNEPPPVAIAVAAVGAA